MSRFYIVLITVIIISGGHLWAQDVDLEGYGAVGFAMYNRNILNDYNQETYIEGKIQAEINYDKYVEAQIDLRGNNADKSVEFKEFSVEFKYLKYANFKFGNYKKPFNYEYLVSRDDLVSVRRSYAQNRIEELGYGGRGIGAMVFYEYDEENPSVPISYFASVFKNNSDFTGINTRFRLHTSEHLAFSAAYQFQHYAGENPINTSGFEADIVFHKKHIEVSWEGYYVQDPYEGVRRELQGLDKMVGGIGSRFLFAYGIKINERALKEIEPFILAGYYRPDSDVPDNHVLQTMLGCNFYINEDVRFRLNADLRLTKNQFNDKYDSKESMGIIEIQVKY